MTILAYCNARQAQLPGSPTRNIRFVTLGPTPVTPPATPAPGPNAAVIAGNQPLVIDLPNILQAAAGEFDAGDSVQITITKVTPAAAPTSAAKAS